MKQQMIAKSSFRYSGRALSAGDHFETTDDYAFILEGVGKARRYAEADQQTHVEESSEIEDVVNDGEISARTGKPKRRYRRRDMRAEQ